jgi:hypothetical protein
MRFTLLRTPKLILILCLLFGSGSFPAIGQTSPPNAADNAVVVQAAAVLETRGIILAPDHHPYVTALNPPELSVILQVSGKALKNPHFVYNVQLAAAGLSDGVDLKFLNPGVNNLVPVDSPLYRSMIWSGELGFPVTLNFATTPLTAKSISILQGSMDVIAGGQIQDIRIHDLSGLVGQTVTQPDLTQAGITLKIDAMQAQSLVIHLNAQPGVVESIAVVRGGVAINSGYILTKISDFESLVEIPLNRAPDARTDLVLHVMWGQKVFHVPFDLQNIPLPR